MRQFLRPLYLKLAAILFLLLVVVGVLQSLRVSISWQEARTQSQQLHYWGLAAGLVDEIQPGVEEELDTISLNRIFRRLKEWFPSFEFYVLDSQGKVLAFSGYNYYERPREQIQLAPIRAALFQVPTPSPPLLGENPRGGADVVFSVSTLALPGSEIGYFYITLDTHSGYSLAKELQLFAALRGAIVDLLMIIFIATVFGVLCFMLITRRFRRVVQAVKAFREGRYSVRVPAEGNDEVSELAITFNEMAARIEETLSQLNLKDKQRRDLVANIAHDLRTPLTAAMAQLQLCSEGIMHFSVDRQRKSLAGIEGSLDSLNRRISDLFELSKLEAKERPLNLIEYPIQKLLHRLSILFEGEAIEKGLELENQCPSNLPAVLADPDMLERAVANLVKNALRYTDEGGKVVLTAFQTTHGQITVEVRDTGIGLSEEDLACIFEQFYRVDKARGSNDAGSGLGLAIVERIIAAHGSKIQVSSELGKGSCFFFSLDLAQENHSLQGT